MTGNWVTLVAALSGAIVGAVAAYANQAAQWRRQQAVRWDVTRRESYSRFLGELNAYFLALCDLSWAIRNHSKQLDARGEQAQRLRSEMLSAKAAADIISSKAVQNALDDAVKYVNDLNARLYEARSGLGSQPRPDLPRMQEYEAQFSPLRDGFVRAVKTELALTTQSVGDHRRR
jgi:hypothetical protein